MAVSIQDYRAFGYWSLPAPLVIAEDDPTTIIQIAALTGQPTGVYTLHAATVWIQDSNKYWEFKLNYPGSDGLVVTKEANGPNDANSSAADVSIFVCTDGIINISAEITFPDQGGTGDGTLLEGVAFWERRAELP